MELKVKRTDVNDVRTFGVFLLNGLSYSYTLERAPNDPIHKSIPAGRYRVTLYKSPHWAADYPEGVPLVNDVPGRSFIEIHPANKVEQLEGCIALGHVKAGDEVEQSRAAYNPFRQQFLAAIARHETVWIEIVDPQKEETVPDAPADVQAA